MTPDNEKTRAFVLNFLAQMDADGTRKVGITTAEQYLYICGAANAYHSQGWWSEDYEAVNANSDIMAFVGEFGWPALESELDNQASQGQWDEWPIPLTIL